MQALAISKRLPVLTSLFVGWSIMLIQPTCCEAVFNYNVVPLCTEGSSGHLLVERECLHDDGIHSLLQPIAKFNMPFSGGFLFCIYGVGQNGTDFDSSAISNDLHLGPISCRFLLVQDVHMLLLVSQEAFDGNEGVMYPLHGGLLVQLNGDRLVIFILPVLII